MLMQIFGSSERKHSAHRMGNNIANIEIRYFSQFSISQAKIELFGVMKPEISRSHCLFVCSQKKGISPNKHTPFHFEFCSSEPFC